MIKGKIIVYESSRSILVKTIIGSIFLYSAIAINLSIIKVLTAGSTIEVIMNNCNNNNNTATTSSNQNTSPETTSSTSNPPTLLNFTVPWFNNNICKAQFC